MTDDNKEFFEKFKTISKIKLGYNRTYVTNEEIYAKFAAVCAREKQKISHLFTGFMLDYIKKHSESNNPQSLIDTYSAEYMIAIPHLLTTLETGGQAKVRQTLQHTPISGLKDIETALHDWTWEIRKELAQR